MGTKNNPGDYDCYAKLGPDEPYFLLRAKDPAAPYLTMMWAASRQGDFAGMLDLVTSMSLNQEILSRVGGEENPKIGETNHCARTMDAWRKSQGGLTAQGKTVMAGELTVKRGGGSEDLAEETHDD